MLNLFPVPQLGLYVTQGYCVGHVFTCVFKLSSWLFFQSPRLVNAPQSQLKHGHFFFLKDLKNIY